MTDEHIAAIDDESDLTATLLASIPSTYKVRGKLDEAGSTGVFGYNQAGSGSGRGVFGRVDSPANDAAGVRGEAANGTAGAMGDGVVGITEDPGASNKFATGVRGEATNISDTQTAGVYGRSDGTADGTRGVNGIAGNGSGGKTYGVVGTSLGASAGAAGVLGAAVDGSTKNYGVEGTTASVTTGAAGVHGSADDTSGQTYGVHGVTKSEETGAAGVRGEATGSAGTIHGVYGFTNSPTGYGIYSDGDAFVNGALDAGQVTANSLSTTNDVDAGDDLLATDNLSIGGYQTIGEVGATAYLGSDQGISDTTQTRVPFDVVQDDDRGEFFPGEGNHYFLTATPGDYHVTANIFWGVEAFTSFSDDFNVYILVNGTVRAKLIGQRGRGENISKTLRGLGEDDQITVDVWQSSGGQANLRGSATGTFITVDKIG